jgi:dihydroflavonol-4-reductase
VKAQLRQSGGAAGRRLSVLGIPEQPSALVGARSDEVIAAVTGAAGHIGANLVRALLAEGRQVRVLVRGDRRALAGLKVQEVPGDIFDAASLARLLQGADTFFHLAGRISIVGAEGGLVQRTNVEGVRSVVEACLAAGVRRLVHCSSIHAYDSHPNDQVVDESRALALGPGHMPYDRSKAGGQTIVLEAVQQRGLDAVVINPGAVVGPHDYKISRMGEVLLDIYYRRLPALIDGGYNWVDARDVAAGAIAAEKSGRSGQCYLLTGHWVHIREVSQLISRLTGRNTPQAALPLWLAMVASAFSLGWGRLRGRTPKFTPGAVRSIRMHRHISCDKARRELGYRPRAFEETLRDTFAWFAEQGLLDGR